MASDPAAPTGIETVAASGPTIWAIGGGKGGVGKSLLSSSLAIALARRGDRCTLVDLDLGAANAHSLLGMRPVSRTLSDFVEHRVETLQEAVSPTPFERLGLVAGTRASLELANPKYSQKERLIRQLQQLEADHVLLDLSAGCAYNVLDFFLAAHHRIAVLIPEATAIENTQHFLKTAFFRSLRPVARHEPLRSAIRDALARPGSTIRSARDLVEAVSEIDATSGERLATRAAAFAPMLVINQVSPHAPPDAASRIALACRHYLAASVRERGRLPRDERVRLALEKRTHVLDAFPGAPFSAAVESLLDDLLSGEPDPRMATVPSRREMADRRRRQPAYEGGDPGAYLRACRERTGLSLEDVARETRIRCLASLEAGRFDALPGETYVAAFVRQYAQLLGVREVDRLTACYLDRCRGSEAPRRRLGPAPSRG